MTETNNQKPMLRLLAASALTGGVLLCLAPQAQAQIVIGGPQQAPDVQIFPTQPSIYGQDGWPYNVRRSKSSWARIDTVDHSTLPTRQVSPALMAAAQTGLPHATLQAPTLAGDKPDQPRNADTTLPPVTTNALMASLSHPETATDNDTADVADNGDHGDTVAVLATTPSADDDAAAILSGKKVAAKAADSQEPVQLSEPARPSTRPLFGGHGKAKTTQMADAAPLDVRIGHEPVIAPEPADTAVPAPAKPVDDAATTDADASAHVLKAPDEAAAAPAEAVVADDTQPARPSVADAPVPVAPVVSSLSHMRSQPPRILAHITEDQQGQATKTVGGASEPVPTPPAPTPEKQPAVAVLPSKAAEEKHVAVLPTPVGADDNGDDDTHADDAKSEIAQLSSTTPPYEVPPAAKAEPEQPGFFARLFGSGNSDTTDKKPTVTAPAPVAEPTPMVPDPEPAVATPAASDSWREPADISPASPQYVPGREPQSLQTPAADAPPKLMTDTTVAPVSPQLVALDTRVPLSEASAPRGAAVKKTQPLSQVSFPAAGTTIDEAGQAALQKVADAMNADPAAQLTLNAYAGSYSSGDARRISLHRALAVRSKLAALGIQPARIHVRALGQDRPQDVDGGPDRVDAILQ